jgi:hypothetical protein
MQQALHPETATMKANSVKMQELMKKESKNIDVKK